MEITSSQVITIGLFLLGHLISSIIWAIRLEGRSSNNENRIKELEIRNKELEFANKANNSEILKELKELRNEIVNLDKTISIHVKSHN